jgi:hypothetical protein
MKALLISFAFAAAVAIPTLAVGAPPAPTLVWSDTGDTAFIRGLTRLGTAVTIKINGQVATGIRYGVARGGVASFAVPWPSILPAGVYEVTAMASRGGLQSAMTDPVDVVVPGVRRAQLRAA